MTVNSTEYENSTNELNETRRLMPTGIVIFLSGLDICLSIAASLGNTLIIIALQKVSSIHPPTKLVFQNQAVTDLCVGLIVQPLHASITIIMGSTARVDPNTEYYVVTAYQVVNYIASGASLVSPAAISIDRLLALRLGLRYRHIVTLKRARLVVCCTWLTGLTGALMYLTLGERITFPMIVVVLIVCYGTANFCYTTIFYRLRRHQARVHDQQGQSNGTGIQLNIKKYKSTVSSMAWVQFVLVLTLVPFIIVVVIIQITGENKDSLLLITATVTVLYSNSSLNPFLYCWKISEVRKAVKDIVRNFCCRS